MSNESTGSTQPQEKMLEAFQLQMIRFLFPDPQLMYFDLAYCLPEDIFLVIKGNSSGQAEPMKKTGNT